MLLLAESVHTELKIKLMTTKLCRFSIFSILVMDSTVYLLHFQDGLEFHRFVRVSDCVVLLILSRSCGSVSCIVAFTNTNTNTNTNGDL